MGRAGPSIFSIFSLPNKKQEKISPSCKYSITELAMFSRMVSLYAIHNITLSATTHSLILNRYPLRSPKNGSKTHPIRPHVQVVYCKRSTFQDFQGYVNPSRLLPATEPEVCTDSSLKDILASVEVERPDFLYKVKLRTSGLYGSGLSDFKAGILLCLVDEKGDSILQRVPAISINSHLNLLEGDDSDSIHFQRGSIDEFTFQGPKLQKIVALWIGPDSGQWRPGCVSLILTHQNRPTLSQDNGNNVQYKCTEYTFETDDILLGEGSDTSMAELRPSQIEEFVEDDITSLNQKLFQPTSMVNDGISKEESMREYADLKASLLLYDVLLVLSGSTIASFSAGKNSGIAFLVGGTIGFLYLFLLQRSVDGLPATGSTLKKNTGMVDDIFGKLKGPVANLILAFTFAVIAVKYGSSDSAMVLTPKEVMCGMLGFLVCKVAVVLAAFKTLPIGAEEKK